MDASHRPPAHRDAGVDSPAAGELRQIHVVRWSDPIVEARGFDLRSRYVETFWLPVLGPSATLLLRRLAVELEVAPGGVDLDTEMLARALGLGIASGRRAPFRRALARCVRFGAARALGTGTLAVRRRLAPVPSRHIAMLPAALQELHATWPCSSPPANGPGLPGMQGQPGWPASPEGRFSPRGSPARASHA